MARNKGWLRDEDWEDPEISFRHQDFKNGNRRTVVVIDGVPQRTRDYRYRRITPAFASPLVNDVNLALCGGFSVFEKAPGKKLNGKTFVKQVLDGTNKNVEGEMIVKQVFDEHKPLGNVYLLGDDSSWWDTTPTQARDRAAALASEAERLGLAVRVEESEENGYYSAPGAIKVDITLSHRGTLGDLFDLDALAEDWRSYLAGHPDEAARTTELLNALRDMCLEQFMDVDFDAEPTPVLGLVLGYPVWSSAALVLDMLGPGKPPPSRRKQAVAMTASHPARSSSVPRPKCGA
jgi:hypothetical protein